MTTKTLGTTLQVPSKPKKVDSGAPKPADFAALWAEARLAYPIYAALATQFKFSALPHSDGELPPVRPTREVFDRDLKWLDSIDNKVRAFQIRQLPPDVLNASDQSLRAFVRRQLRKPDKTTVDRDKIDFLLVQYFALCAPDQLYRTEVTLDDVARVLQPVLAEADATPLEWCAPLDDILGKVDQCHSLRDMMENGLLEQGRMLKESAECMFYDPAALVAFCRFNFVLRRAFIRLLHSDLAAVQQAVDALESQGVKAVDCRRAGFSAAETTTQLRFFYENWRQPFQKDYTENSVTHAFEQLLALRADVEEAAARMRSAAAPSAAPAQTGPAAKKTEKVAAPTASPAPPAAVQVTPPTAPGPKRPGQTAPATAQPAPSTHADAGKPAPPAASGPSESAVDPEKCLEAIWEQLIAAPPSRGRSMSTVVLQDTKVLLSSWEVAAFVSEGGQESEDLRRAVVARALLAVAMDQRKRCGEARALSSALTLARSEVSYFQGRVEQAKRAKNTEAAVNLGISTKRLLSFIEEAEKLQP